MSGGYVYVSACADECIHVLRVHGERMERAADIKVKGGPRTLVFSRNGKYMYVATQSGEVAFFTREDAAHPREQVRLTADQRLCNLCLSPDENTLIGTSYCGGQVECWELEGQSAGRHTLVRTAFAAHCAVFMDERRFAVVHPDTRRLYYMTLDAPGNVQIAGFCEMQYDLRHLAHKAGTDWYYGIAYEDNAICALRRSGGTLHLESALSSLPDGFAGYSIGSDIQLGNDGYLYAANRGADDIVVCRAEGARIRKLGFINVDPEPISFCLNEEGNTLYAAGKLSGRLCACRLSSDHRSVERKMTLDVGREVLWIAYRSDKK